MNKRFSHRSPDVDPDGDGYWLILQGHDIWLESTGAGKKLPFGSLEDIQNQCGIDSNPSETPLFLGVWDGSPCRVIDISTKTTLPESLLLGLVKAGIRADQPEMSADIMSLAGLALQTLHWQSRTKFCGQCGGQTVHIKGECGVTCPDCNHVQYPTISPCVIVLIKRDDEVLLITKDEWPEGRYSLVAGFVDMGECLEEAVVREAMEETGIKVKNIEYIGSQSWPFPSQLMVGYVAQYDGGEIVMEDDEISDAQWFKIDNLPDMPPQRSIARYILDHFAIPTT